MPKDRRSRSVSLHRSGASPYPCSSKNADPHSTKNPAVEAGDEKEWEEASCPICMEHPHNAVLLLCSSYDKGCRPFMCNTSHRHSNCLDQFRKSLAAKSSGALAEEVPLFHTVHQRESGHGNPIFCGRQRPELVCPLCRGQINGSIIIEPARHFMNSIPRTCSLETCNFSGTYSDLRRHARAEHPSVQPSQADPKRERDWMRLEREMEFQDVLGAFHLDTGDDLGEYSIFNREADWAWLDNDRAFEDIFSSLESEDEFDSLMGMMDFELELPFSFLGEVFVPDPLFQMGGYSSSRRGDQSYESGSSRRRDQLYDNSRSSRRSITTYPTETGPSAGGDDVSQSWRYVGGSQRRNRSNRRGPRANNY